jgi:hypothetical protein
VRKNKELTQINIFISKVSPRVLDFATAGCLGVELEKV